MPEKIDCAVIGAGIVGLAIARELALDGREVVILEAESAIGTHTSSRNSEVIHAGLFYLTGSLKARLCVAGRKAMYQYCAERGINHRRIGKIIIATDETQLEKLIEYKTQAEINGVDDLRMLSRAEIGEFEPAVVAAAGFFSPSTGIVDSHGLILSYLADAENYGASLVLNSPVTTGRVSADDIVIDVAGTAPVQITCNTVINAAGHGAQAVARNIQGVPAPTIPPNYYAIGHYYVLSGNSPFNHLVYPVHRPVQYQDSLGVHVTVDLDGRCKFGPDFEWVDRLDYRFDESREARFYEAIRRYYPGLRDGALQPGYTGIRPRITGAGSPVVDFMIHGPNDHGIPGLVNLYGIESPGLTASLAIASHVRKLLDGKAGSG